MRLGTCVTSSSGALPSSEHDSSSKTISTPASLRMSPCKQGLPSAESSLLLSSSSQCGDLPSSPLNDLPSLVGVSPSGKPTWQVCPSSVNCSKLLLSPSVLLPCVTEQQHHNRSHSHPEAHDINFPPTIHTLGLSLLWRPQQLCAFRGNETSGTAGLRGEAVLWCRAALLPLV